MIKIPNLLSVCSCEDKSEYNKLAKSYILKRLETFWQKYYIDSHPKVNSIFENIKTIVSSNDDYFLKTIDESNELLSIPKVEKKDESCYLKTGLDFIFNWNTFRKRKSTKLIFKKLFTKLGIQICPYCNRNYISIFDKSRKSNNGSIVLPTFDHFLPKSKYPHLALLLSNLIPSCEYCNSKLKSDINDKPILYPYLEGFDEKARFFLEPPQDNLTALSVTACHISRQPENFYNKFHLNFIINNTVTNEQTERIKNSIQLFQLIEVYNAIHGRDAVDMAIKTQYFNNKAYKQSFISILNPKPRNSSKQLISFNDSQEDLFKFLIFGRSLDFGSQLSEPLSKLKNDIFFQFSDKDIDKNYFILNYGRLKK